MTTAHRPTWNPVAGGKDQGGNRVLVPSRQYSSKDLPGHTTLKFRKNGQGEREEVRNIDYRQELLKKELEYKLMKKSELTGKIEEEEDEDSEIDDEEIDESEEKGEKGEDEDEDSSDSSDFSEEELKREIENIKKERAETERATREQEEQEERSKQKEEILKGNPLLDIAPGFSLKRKWTEETIFRNQSRDEPKEILSFVNDTVRSDFHRKVLRKYIV